MLRHANASQMLMQKLWRCVRGKQSLSAPLPPGDFFQFKISILDMISQYLDFNNGEKLVGSNNNGAIPMFILLDFWFWQFLLTVGNSDTRKIIVRYLGGTFKYI